MPVRSSGESNTFPALNISLDAKIPLILIKAQQSGK